MRSLDYVLGIPPPSASSSTIPLISALRTSQLLNKRTSACRGASGMPRGVKGFLVAITSVIYLFVLTAFFIAQQAVLVAGKIKGPVIEWSPEKPRAFGMRL